MAVRETTAVAVALMLFAAMAVAETSWDVGGCTEATRFCRNYRHIIGNKTDCHTTRAGNTDIGSHRAWYKKYRYIPQQDRDGGEAAGWVKLGEGQSLVSAWPNPAAGATRLAYYLEQGGPCRLELLDVQGRAVRTLLSGSAQPGGYSVVWDGRDDGGRPVPQGTYYCRLVAGPTVSGLVISLVK